jgi:DNA-binding CsgD family transcriptional regulator
MRERKESSVTLSEVEAFMDALPRLETAAAVGHALTRAIAPHGYFAAACEGSRETPKGRMLRFFFNTWPKDWLRQYQERNYVHHDLVPTIARLASWPFTWREATIGRQRTAEQMAFADWIASLGIVDAFAVPVHLPGNDFGLCVSLADHPIENLSERRALHIASLHAHQRCLELAGPLEACSIKSPLSAREAECLRWVLQGKSDKVIAAIVGISHTTVHFHIERMKRKLGVKTRAQAAGAAVTLGYL